MPQWDVAIIVSVRADTADEAWEKAQALAVEANLPVLSIDEPEEVED